MQVGQLVSVNVNTPSKWGLVLGVVGVKVYVQWGFKAEWHNQENLGRWWSLAGVGTYLIDWVRWLFIPTCGSICRLDSIISRGRLSCRGDEAATVNLQFKSGATAQICSSVLADDPTRSEIIGSAGYAYCENTFGQTGGGLIKISGKRLHFDFINPYVREIDDFVSAINNGRKLKISGEEGLRNIGCSLKARC